MKNIKILIYTVACCILLSCEQDTVKIPVQIDPDKPYTTPALDALWEKVKTNGDGLESRQIFEFLLEATSYKWEQSYLRTALENATDMQFTDSSDPYYGNFIFTKGINPSVIDENAVEFCMEKAAVLRKLYFDHLDEHNQKLLDEMIERSIIAARRHDVAVSYTNIYLMKTWMLCALGEATGNSTAVNEGAAMLDTWIARIKTYGIEEYNSPTYSGIAAVALGCLANLSDNPVIKSKASVALEYFNLLLFGNYFSTGMYLGGPHARDYNYLSSRSDYTDALMQYYIKGYAVPFHTSHALWTPTSQATELLNKVPRTIVYKTGEGDDNNVISYIGNKINMGSAGMAYGPDDKNFVINLASPSHPLVVNISSVIEGRDIPYGDQSTPTADGHSKPRHLWQCLLARAQRDILSSGKSIGSETVFILSTDGRDRGDTEKLFSHVIVPSSNIDGMWNGHRQITDISSISTLPLSDDDKQTFFIRFEDTAVGIRYLLAKDIQGNSVPVNLINRKKTSTQGQAMHLSAQLSTKRPESGENGIVAMWWRVKEGIEDDNSFQSFRNEMINADTEVHISGTDYTVKVKSPESMEPLGVSGNISTRKQTANFGGMTLPTGIIYTVDGIDIAAPVFNKLVN